jgi:hypothetical protein
MDSVSSALIAVQREGRPPQESGRTPVGVGLRTGRPAVRLVILLSAVVTGACGTPPLTNAQPSSEGLARELLSALARRDETQLQALAVTSEEFEQRVWPELPAARPERNLPWSYVWMDLRQKSDAMLRRTLNEYGGRAYQLETVRFDGQATTHGSYRVFRETTLVVRDGVGARHELRLCGSMIQADGGWKVFSYVVDE